MLARSVAVIPVRRCSSCSALVCAPDASTSSPPVIHRWSKLGSLSRTLPMISACAPVSAKTAHAEESLRIHWTCSAEEVS